MQEFWLGDVFEVLGHLDPHIVNLVLTSPPYWGQRSYTPDDDREIGGSGQPLYAYLDDMRKLGEALHRVCDPNATWWLNLGDTAVGSGGAGGDYNSGGSYERRARYKQGESSLAKGQWADVPGRVVHVLQATGWLLRSEVIWDKGAVRHGDYNISHTRRPGLAHEKLFMLTRSSAYHFNLEQPKHWYKSIWAIKPSSGANAGKAPWPVQMAARCIRLSSRRGDVVLDPFVGSGNTLAATERLRRQGVGIDLDPDALALAMERFPGIITPRQLAA